MLRVVHYARVSTEQEKQLSALSGQIADNRSFINKNADWELVDEYVDEGKSATTTKGRKEFLRMLEDLKNDKFDICLIKDYSRGWRNLSDWLIFQVLLRDHKKQLFIRTENRFYDPKDKYAKLNVTMVNMMSELYTDNLSGTINERAQERMLTGSTVWTNGRMWGYDQANREITINEEEAELVREIFDLYISGKGMRAIETLLHSRGVKNRDGGEFSCTTLRRMIRNEKYKGELVCRKTHRNFDTKKVEKLPQEEWIIHKDRVPAIVSVETWDRANTIIDSRKEKNKSGQNTGVYKGKFPLSGKIKCSTCGSTYYHICYKNKSYPRWICSKYKVYGNTERGCSCGRIIKDEVLNDITNKVVHDFWKNKDETINNMMAILEKIIKEDTNSIETKKIQLKIQKTEYKMENMRSFLADGTITKEEYTTDVKKYKTEVDDMKKELDILLSNDSGKIDKKMRLKKIKKHLDHIKLDKNKTPDEIISSLITKVTVYQDKLIYELLDFHEVIMPLNPRY